MILNIYFLLLWFWRFVEVLLRTYIDKLKTYKWFNYLMGERKLDNYERNLKKLIREYYKSEKPFSKRFVANRSESGKLEDDPVMCTQKT